MCAPPRSVMARTEGGTNPVPVNVMRNCSVVFPDVYKDSSLEPGLGRVDRNITKKKNTSPVPGNAP